MWQGKQRIFVYELYSAACLHNLLLGFSHSAVNLAVPMGLGFETAPKLQDFEMALEFKKAVRVELRDAVVWLLDPAPLNFTHLQTAMCLLHGRIG